MYKKIGICVNCGNTIVMNTSTKKYCNKECEKEYRIKTKGVKKKCEVCGNDFIAPPDHKEQRFCSRTCQGKWQSTKTGRDNPKYKRVETTCDWCNKTFDMRNYMVGKDKHNFCSVECSRAWYSNVFSQSEEWKEESRKRATKLLNDGIIEKTDTAPQLKVNSMLDDLKIQYENEYNCIYYAVDNAIFYNKQIYFIEVMGTYWHCDRRFYPQIKYQQQWDRISKDKAKNKFIKEKYNVNILYLWESDIDNKELCKKLIMLYLNNELTIYDSSYYFINEYGNVELNQFVKELQFMNYDLEYLKLYVNITHGEKRSMKQNDKWITYNCEFCGKEKEVLISHYNKVNHHYCSNECRIQAMKHKVA